MALGAGRSSADGDVVDYVRDVRPILAENCYKCHGADEQKSGLRLDSVASAIEGGYSGPAVERGKSADSLLVQAVSGAEGVKPMPPEGPRLSAAQIALVTRWIDAGAIAPADEAPAPASARRKSDHWSFQPVAHPDVPTVSQMVAKYPHCVRNPLDAFIVGRLAREGIAPAPEADRVTLIRRLSLDLLGLLPTVAEVDEFVADQRPDAYDQLVERLLASPHYGERQARHWLDLARYADSNGYTNDNPRSIWKYRDWVIDALNRDMPFDQFTIEQFAGDMLPGATLDQRIATGFHRNTLQNEEGGTDPEEFRIESVVDRVSTTGSVYLGLSLGCARCHDHKFDPISQRDFYQMFALLNGADEPTLPVPTEDQARRQEELTAKVAAATKELNDYDDQSAPQRAVWEQQFAGKLEVNWSVLDPSAFSTAGGSTLQKLDDRSLLPGGDRPAVDTYTVTAAAPLPTVTGLRVEALTHDSLPRHGPGRADNGNFVLSEVALDLVNPAPTDNTGSAVQHVVWQSASADYAQDKFPAAHLIDGKEQTGWAIYVVDTTPHLDRTAVLVARDDCVADGKQLVVSLAQRYAKPHLLLGRFRLSVTAASRMVLELAEPVRAALQVAVTDRTPAQQQLVLDEYQKIDPRRQALVAHVTESKRELEKLKQGITTTLVMHEREKPRETRILIRGEYLRNGPVVHADVPSVLPPLPGEAKTRSRLDLARWLVDPANPLVARVTMNRLWQQLFGRGLVETSNDFGIQGSTPTHPELLDWLASEFIAHGWSMKAAHRLIVTSATYRQVSTARPELAAIDADNWLLARQSRLRVEAETVRDVMLAASGLLSHKVGGPSVYPPQPDGVMALTRSPREWPTSKGEDRYRRGMYTYFWRSTPHPFLKVFDAPDGITTCTRRDRANTPLQALTLLNDEACIEAARALATSTLTELPSAATTDRLRYAFRRCLAREPNDAERACMAELLADELADAALATVSADKSPSPGIDARLLSAWTTVGRALLNLDEFMTRE
jgi:mono/diheme cytochrome c family protein